MRVIPLIIAISLFASFDSYQDTNTMKNYEESPILKIEYKSFKWVDGKKYVFLCISLDYSYSKLEGEGKGADPFGQVTGSGIHDPEHFHTRIRNMSLINYLNSKNLKLTISNDNRFFNALSIKPSTSDFYINNIKNRLHELLDTNYEPSPSKREDCFLKDDKYNPACWRSLKLYGLFLLDDFDQFENDEKFIISLSSLNTTDERSGRFIFKREEIDIKAIIEPFDSDKFDPSIPKATRAWHQQWVREQKDKNSNQK